LGSSINAQWAARLDRDQAGMIRPPRRDRRQARPPQRSRSRIGPPPLIRSAR
jgi:hypothetical protein